MRDFAQPRVLASALTAAVITALACFPRLAQWPERQELLWFYVATLFSCSIVLWGFVFAWHVKYLKRPLFPAKQDIRLLVPLIGFALAAAAVFHFCFDPGLRAKIPTDYPVDRRQWLAMTFFSLGFQLLFFLFAPLAFFARLIPRLNITVNLTIAFGLALFILKNHSILHAFSPLFFASLLVTRVLAGYFAIYVYLRGGIFPVLLWSFLMQLRHLADV